MNKGMLDRKYINELIRVREQEKGILEMEKKKGGKVDWTGWKESVRVVLATVPLLYKERNTSVGDFRA